MYRADSSEWSKEEERTPSRGGLALLPPSPPSSTSLPDPRDHGPNSPTPTYLLMSSSSPVKKTPAGKKRSTVSPTPSTVPLPAPLQPAFVPPVQIRRIPKKLNVFQQAWIWYEGSFAISMLETVRPLLPSSTCRANGRFAVGEDPFTCVAL